jgi:hypothetical protein
LHYSPQAFIPNHNTIQYNVTNVNTAQRLSQTG